MKPKQRVNRIFAGAAAAYFATAAFLAGFVFAKTGDFAVRLAVALCSILFFLIGIALIVLLKKEVVRFSKEIGKCIDEMISNKTPDFFAIYSESLLSKLNFKLKRLFEIMRQNLSETQSEKDKIQQIVSDISHQVKTPITNLKIYSSTLLERRLPAEKETEFLKLMDAQIEKLSFLMQSLVKMSRLETGIITLKVKPNKIYETIARALSNIVVSAEKKGIDVTVDCGLDIVVPHDKKWTAEALFNILDNAVKYTDPGGKITVTVEQWEMVTKIDIQDTGKGIPQRQIPDIFKRFYRGGDADNVEGAGLGLYLSREIISLQGGYIEVKSEVNKGSTFSVFLQNRAKS